MKLQCIELLHWTFDSTSAHWTFALNFYIELLIQNFSTLNFCIEVMVQKFNALNLCIELSEQNFNIMIFRIDLFTLNFCSQTSMHWTLVHSVTYSSELLRIGVVVQLWDWRFVTANWFCWMLRAFMWTAFEPTPHQSKQVGLHLERIAGNIYILILSDCWHAGKIIPDAYAFQHKWKKGCILLDTSCSMEWKGSTLNPKH